MILEWTWVLVSPKVTQISCAEEGESVRGGFIYICAYVGGFPLLDAAALVRVLGGVFNEYFTSQITAQGLLRKYL